MDKTMEFGVSVGSSGRLVADESQDRAAAAFGDNPFKAKVPGAIEGVKSRKLFKDEAWTCSPAAKEQEATFKWSHANDPCVVVNMNPFPLAGEWWHALRLSGSGLRAPEKPLSLSCSAIPNGLHRIRARDSTTFRTSIRGPAIRQSRLASTSGPTTSKKKRAAS